MFDVYELQDSLPSAKRFTAAALVALAVMGVGVLVLLILQPDRLSRAIQSKTIEISFRPLPTPPEPVKVQPAPPKPPKILAKKVPPPKKAPVARPKVKAKAVTPPPPSAAALVAPDEIPQAAAPESDTAVAAINLAVGGTGDGSGTGIEESGATDVDPPAPVAAAKPAPIHLPEEADPAAPHEGNESPEYPETARSTGQEARVILKIIVERNGHVGRIQVLRGSEPFVSAALVAVERWTYEPARLNGKAISVFKIINLKFKLRSV